MVLLLVAMDTSRRRRREVLVSVMSYCGLSEVLRLQDLSGELSILMDVSLFGNVSDLSDLERSISKRPSAENDHKSVNFGC